MSLEVVDLEDEALVLMDLGAQDLDDSNLMDWEEAHADLGESHGGSGLFFCSGFLGNEAIEAADRKSGSMDDLVGMASLDVDASAGLDLMEVTGNEGPDEANPGRWEEAGEVELSLLLLFLESPSFVRVWLLCSAGSGWFWISSHSDISP